MSAKQNLELIERHMEAVRSGDEKTFAADYAENAVVRTAGVPGSLGGVLEGRQQIVENFRRQVQPVFEVRQMFGDDSRVCVVARVTTTLAGTEFLRGNDAPYSAFECATYRIVDGRIREQTVYVNWLDVYVQTGLVDVNSLTA
jgi:ketosteroid isomerase-like protein